MTLSIKPLSFKPPKLRGLPRAQLDTAFEGHYGKALQQHNAIDAASQSQDSIDQRALKAVEISLFECYFESLTDEETGEPSAELEAAMKKAFSNGADFESSLKSAAADRETGWLTWLRNNSDDALTIEWTSGSTRVPDDQQVLLAIPLQSNIREVGFTDGINAYIDAVLSNLKWSTLNHRFARTDSDDSVADDMYAPEALALALKNNSPVNVLDVRLADDLQADDVQVDGSRWFDPLKVAQWADSVAGDKEVIVYCMYGAWVSQKAAAELREQGVPAKVLAGGISSWQALGLSTQALDKNAASNT